MAKTRSAAVVSEEPVLELSRTLKIGDTTYNINAKTVEKTNHPLVINQITLDEPVSMTFDGSSDQNINIVAAEGGRFTGKIAVPNASANAFVEDGEMVVNYNDIKNIVLDQFMNNSVLSTWDGTKLLTGGQTADIKSVGIITGPDSEASDFALYNYNAARDNSTNTAAFAAFIYVASNGKIYFGNVDSKSLAAVELSAQNAVHANEADEAEKLVGTVNNEKTTYTVENIAEIVSDISTNAENISTNAENISNNASAIAKNTVNISANTSAIAKNTANIATNTANITTVTGTANQNAADISNIVDGTRKVVRSDGSVVYKTAVGKATEATKIVAIKTKLTGDKEIYADSTEWIDGTTIANTVATVNSISKNYYKSAFNTTDVNSIFITASSAEKPIEDTTKLKNGDIWIKYS